LLWIITDNHFGPLQIGMEVHETGFLTELMENIEQNLSESGPRLALS